LGTEPQHMILVYLVACDKIRTEQRAGIAPTTGSH
jgi:hypothetical protein